MVLAELRGERPAKPHREPRRLACVSLLLSQLRANPRIMPERRGRPRSDAWHNEYRSQLSRSGASTNRFSSRRRRREDAGGPNPAAVHHRHPRPTISQTSSRPDLRVRGVGPRLVSFVSVLGHPEIPPELDNGRTLLVLRSTASHELRSRRHSGREPDRVRSARYSREWANIWKTKRLPHPFR